MVVERPTESQAQGVEQVYVVRRTDLLARECPQGFLGLGPDALRQAYLSTIETRGFFIERPHAENDPTLKQIIPYCIATDGVRAFSLTRQSTQGEARLHHKISIGIGGHLNPVDAKRGNREVVACGAVREICEELEVDQADPQPVGALNDDSNSVGSVHFGLVHLVRVPADVRVRETDRMVGRFAAWGDLRAELARGANFESWSALILRSWTPEEFARVAASAGSAGHSAHLSHASSAAQASSSR